MSELDPKWEAMCLAEVEKWRGMRFSERRVAEHDFMWRVAAGLELESAALRARVEASERGRAIEDRLKMEALAELDEVRARLADSERVRDDETKRRKQLNEIDLMDRAALNEARADLAAAEALLGRWRSNLGQLTATLLHEGREIGAVALQPWFLHVEEETRAFLARGGEK